MSRHDRPLYTLGYSGYTPASFLQVLQAHQIQLVIDVRQNPISRKPGFSRRNLELLLATPGIQYLHHPELGVPRNLRDRLRNKELKRGEYLKAFQQHLATALPALDSLRQLAVEKRCCLICLEHDFAECHRSQVAEAVVQRPGKPLNIIHL